MSYLTHPVHSRHYSCSLISTTMAVGGGLMFLTGMLAFGKVTFFGNIGITGAAVFTSLGAIAFVASMSSFVAVIVLRTRQKSPLLRNDLLEKEMEMQAVNLHDRLSNAIDQGDSNLYHRILLELSIKDRQEILYKEKDGSSLFEKALMSANSVIINITLTAGGELEKAFIIALQKKNLELFDHLFTHAEQKGKEVGDNKKLFTHKKDLNGRNLLHLAVLHGCFEIIEFLIRKNFPTDVVDNANKKAVDYTTDKQIIDCLNST